MSNKHLKNKKIAMIIAPRDFRDEEYFIPKEVFEDKGVQVTTFSSKKGEAVGSYGGVIEIEHTLEELAPGDFDVVVFVGGSGAVQYAENKICHQIAGQTLEQDKVLAAICIAPLILANSGVLKGKKATVWSGKINKEPVEILEEKGAQYVARKVVKDGNIITASGPQAARQFARVILEEMF